MSSLIKNLRLSPISSRAEHAAILVQPSGDSSGTKDMQSIQAAHEFLLDCQKGAGTIDLLPGGRYYLNNSLTLRTARVGLHGNCARIFSSQAGPAINITTDASDSQYGAEAHSIENLKIIGPGQGVAGSMAFRYTAGAATKSARPTFRNLHIASFGTGIKCEDQAYLAMLYNVAMNDCAIGFHQAVGSDSGENIAWLGGSIGNSGTAILLEDDTSELFCYGLSVDYCNKWADIRSGVLNLHGCHLERHSGFLNTPISVSGDGSGFVMNGGSLGLTEQPGFPSPYGYPSIIDLNGATTRGVFRDVRMVNLRNSADMFSTGTGQCVIDGVIAFTSASLPRQVGPVTGPANLATDGNVSQATVADSWHVYSCQSNTYTNRLLSGAHSVVVSTDRAYSGSQSIKLARGNVGSGYVGVFAMMIPLPNKPGARLLGAMRVGRTEAGVPVKVGVSFARINRQDATIQGKFVFTRETTPIITDVNADTAGVGSFVELGNGQTVIPTWADVLVIKIDMTYNNANSAVYVDDVNVSVV